MSRRQTLDRLTAAMLERMTDAELIAVIGTDPANLSDFSDAQLQALASGTAGPDLCKRFDAATRPSVQAAA
ncbi:MAG: hypothetical protein ACOYNZ_07330 [Rhodoferax sp.]